jgi:hypothetical protein
MISTSKFEAIPLQVVVMEDTVREIGSIVEFQCKIVNVVANLRGQTEECELIWFFEAL